MRPSLSDRTSLHALHGVARLAVRLLTPVRAKRLLDRLGGGLRAYRTPDELRAGAHVLDGHGTCLTRALTLAARAPGAEVVIAVDPRRSASLHAHAWVEFAGTTFGEDGARAGGAGEIARLSRAI
jgi:hypothetical protein